MRVENSHHWPSLGYIHLDEYIEFKGLYIEYCTEFKRPFFSILGNHHNRILFFKTVPLVKGSKQMKTNYSI